MLKNITAIILAGGRSSRMGRNKCSLKTRDGKIFIENIAEKFSPFVKEIIISTNSKEFNYLGFTVVKDIFPNHGPIAGIYSALKKSSSQLNIIVPCDMPFISLKLYIHLLQKMDGAKIIYPVFKGQIFPLNSIIHRETLPTLYTQLLSNDNKIRNLISIIKSRRIEIKNPECEKIFVNINTPEDYLKYYAKQFVS